jgi:hypothetical protein
MFCVQRGAFEIACNRTAVTGVSIILNAYASVLWYSTKVGQEESHSEGIVIMFTLEVRPAVTVNMVRNITI